MDQMQGNEAVTVAERLSDRELVVTRSFDAPAHIVFQAWARPELFRQWWVPKSFGMTLLACEMDVRIGGNYRLEFGHPQFDQPMAVFGTYLEVVPDSCLSWTNEESDDGAVTTVTFEEAEGRTLVKVHNLFPSKEALDAEIASGGTSGMGETLDQLDQFISEQVQR